MSELEAPSSLLSGSEWSGGRRGAQACGLCSTGLRHLLESIFQQAEAGPFDVGDQLLALAFDELWGIMA